VGEGCLFRGKCVCVVGGKVTGDWDFELQTIVGRVNAKGKREKMLKGGEGERNIRGGNRAVLKLEKKCVGGCGKGGS